MSLEILLGALRERAEAEREQILSRAREEAERILSDAREERAEGRDAYLERVEREARAEARRKGAEARREARARVLAVRSEALQAVFDEARAGLPELLDSDAYRETLPGVLASGLERVGGEGVVVRCTPGTRQALIDALAALEEDGEGGGSERGGDPDRVSGVTEDGEVEAGFRLVGEDGDLVVDGSLSAALRRLRPRLRIELVREVEGETGLPTLSELEGRDREATPSVGGNAPESSR